MTACALAITSIASSKTCTPIAAPPRASPRSAPIQSCPARSVTPTRCARSDAPIVSISIRPIRPDAPITAIPMLSVMSLPFRVSARSYPNAASAGSRRLRDGPASHIWRLRKEPLLMAKNRFNEGSGPSQRQLRVGELIRRTLSDVLARGDVHDPDLNRMSITVGEVRTSPDLKIATVYVMPLGGGQRREAIDALKRNRGELRRAIMKDMTLKYAPDLRFVIDAPFDQMDDTRRIFAQDAVRRDIEGGDEAEDAE